VFSGVADKVQVHGDGVAEGLAAVDKRFALHGHVLRQS
jgi:hypothetical protein